MARRMRPTWPRIPGAGAVTVALILGLLAPTAAASAATASAGAVGATTITGPSARDSAARAGVAIDGPGDAADSSAGAATTTGTAPPAADGDADTASAPPTDAPTGEPAGAGPSGGDGDTSTAPDTGTGTSTAPSDQAPSAGDAEAPPAPADDPIADTAPAQPPTPLAPTPAADPALGVTTVDPPPLPASEWIASAAPATGQVLVQSDPAGIDYAVDVSWAAPADAATAVRGYRIELFAGRTVANTSTLIARTEVAADTTSYRVEGVAFGAATVTARVTLLDGAAALPNPLVSDPLTLPASSGGILSDARAGTPTLSAPTDDGVTVSWEPVPSDPAPSPAGYVVRLLERRHDLAATSANFYQVANYDAGAATSAVLTGLQGSSRYLAGVVAYDLVDGVKRFRPSSGTSTVPAWSSDYPAQTRGARTPITEWPNPPAAPAADTARSLTWTGTPTTGRYTGGSPITGYRVELHQAGVGLVAETDIAVADPAAPPSTAFRGLTAGAGYSVRVAAANAEGTGELSDFSPLTATPAGSAPGSRPPAYADRAALDAAISTGKVAVYEPTTAITAVQGADATVEVPWTTAQSGEAWWYGSATLAATATTTGSGTGPAHPSLTVSTAGLPVGTHWLLFVTDAELDGEPAPAGGRATAVRVEITAAADGVLTLDNAVLRWGLNDETNNGAYFGGCNYLSAGRTPDPGGSVIFTSAQYAASAGTVSIEKPDASGRFVPASWETKCLDRTGAPLSSGTTTPYGGNQFVMTSGIGEVDRATGSASIRWAGDVTVAYYGGMAFWYLSDPVLTVENGAGTLTATVGGFGTDMDDLSKWQPLADRTVTVATFSGVQVGPDGFTATPDYRGVAVSLPRGQVAQTLSGPDWGSFPQSFIDFQLESGSAAYWYSSGGLADAAKPAQPIVIGYDAATFAPPTAPAADTGKASARAPVAKLPPAKIPAAFLLPAASDASAASASAPAASSVVIVETPTRAGLADEVLMLLIALVALLGLIIVVAALGGGVLVLSTPPRR